MIVRVDLEPSFFSPEYLEWVEKAAIENLRGRLATGDVLLAQANQLLSLLMVGIAGSLVYGAKIFGDGPGPLEWGAAATSAWLSACTVVLTFMCIATRTTQALYNEPKNLLVPGVGIDAARFWETQLVQRRIELTRARNASVAHWLDICRYATALTPVAFSAGALALG